MLHLQCVGEARQKASTAAVDRHVGVDDRKDHARVAGGRRESLHVAPGGKGLPCPAVAGEHRHGPRVVHPADHRVVERADAFERLAVAIVLNHDPFDLELTLAGRDGAPIDVASGHCWS